MGNKIAHVSFFALMPKGCNFIAPLALMQQFLSALFFSFLANRERAERQVDEHNIIKKEPPENVEEIMLQDDEVLSVMENDKSSILSKGKTWPLEFDNR